MTQLPIDSLKQDVIDALSHGSVLIEAEPGAGKSTRVPLWALTATDQQVWLIQPRVLPTQALARRLAASLNEPVGVQVGFQVPFIKKHSDSTRLLVMTPGILLQRLLADPELNGVGVVILDEVHERSVTQDISWALLQEAQILREHLLALVLMSATPEAALRQQVAQHLTAAGRCFPVALSYCPPEARARYPEPLAAHLLRALAQVDNWLAQTVLVFLPGWRDIENCRRALEQHANGVNILRLHSRVAAAEQQRALDERLGPRVILATNIAETSLTIADVTVVIDSGLARSNDFEQGTGVSRLSTRRISQANAEQRRGRAGRVQAGRCIRLWSETEALAPMQLPEIRRTDYLPLALWCAHWGTAWQQLPWLEAPGAMGMQQAQSSLLRWQLLDTDGQISDRGRQVAALGTHPRTAALLLVTKAWLDDHPWLLLSALALHFDWPVSPGMALPAWLSTAAAELAGNKQWQQQQQRWCRVLSCPPVASERIPDQLPAALIERLAEAFPERIGHRQASGRYRLNSGISVGAEADSEWLFIVQLGAEGKGHSGVGMALDVPETVLLQLAQEQIETDWYNGRWVRFSRFMLGGRQVRETRTTITQDALPESVLAYIRERGLGAIHWPEIARLLLARVEIAYEYQLLPLPDISLPALETSMEVWLAPFINSECSAERLPLAQGLEFYLGFDTCKALDRLLPSHLTLPSGRTVPVNYGQSADVRTLRSASGKVPAVAGKLQEFFGVANFALPDARVPLALELLSPAGRPLAVTRDLDYFWREVYPQVRRENRGRYAKHPWPEAPLAHAATGFTNKRLHAGE